MPDFASRGKISFLRRRGEGARRFSRAARAVGVIGARRGPTAARRSSARLRSNVRTAGFLGIEKKFYDTTLATTALVAPTDGAGGELDPTTVNSISAPAQGDGESNRDGKKIMMKSVHVTGRVQFTDNTGETAGRINATAIVALVLDTQSNGAQLNSEDVFTNPGGTALLASAPLRNLQYSTRFKVLATKTMSMVARPVWDGTNIELFSQSNIFRFDKKLDMPVEFTGTAAGVANVMNNSIHVVGYSDTLNGVPKITYNARLRFVG